jgi:hypothetical protein
MTIGRRGALGLGAFGIGSVALGGCGSTLPEGERSTTGAGVPPTIPMEDLDRLLSDHDRVMAHLRASDPGQARTANDQETGDPTCSRILEAVCLMGTYRDVPHAAWRERRVEKRMADTLPGVHATLAVARQHLAEISDAHGSRIDDMLRDEPDFPMRVLERIDEHAKRIRVPTEQRLHLRLAVTQLSSRLRYEGTKEVTSSLVAKFDRALASRASLLGVRAKSEPPQDPAPAGPSTAQGPPHIHDRPRGSVGESCLSNDDCDSLLCSSSACKVVEPFKSPSDRLRATTKKTAVVGLYLLIPPICAIGVLVLLTCLFMLIVAASLPEKGG